MTSNHDAWNRQRWAEHLGSCTVCSKAFAPGSEVSVKMLRARCLKGASLMTPVVRELHELRRDPKMHYPALNNRRFKT